MKYSRHEEFRDDDGHSRRRPMSPESWRRRHQSSPPTYYDERRHHGPERTRSHYDSPPRSYYYESPPRARSYYYDRPEPSRYRHSPVARPTRINLDEDDLWMPSNYRQRHRYNEPPPRKSHRDRDYSASPRNIPRRKSMSSERIAHRNDDDAQSVASESDAFSVFAHIHTDSDSGSSANENNFDEDDNDHVESGPPKRSSRRKPTKAKKAKKKAPVAETSPGSGSSFTMGSSQESIQIEAIAPPGPQVAVNDDAAIGGLLWVVDYLDRFNLGATIALALIVVCAFITAIAMHEPSCYVIAGVYAILWFLVHREIRELQVQMRAVHDHHAAMPATQLQAIDMTGIARRTIEVITQKLKKIIQVSAGGSVVFLMLIAALSIWSQTWATFSVAAVVMLLSAATAAVSVVQYRWMNDITNSMMTGDEIT